MSVIALFREEIRKMVVQKVAVVFRDNTKIKS